MTKTTVSAPHPLDQALALDPVVVTAHEHGRESTRHWQGRTHPGYMNMVGPFGGITAAQALNAVLQHPELLGEPISFTANFAAALAEGAFRAEARPVRTNRSTQHWTVTLSQTDAQGVESVVLTATAVTAKRRATWSAVDAVMPEVPRPQSIPRVPLIRAVAWPQRYDMRPCAGQVPTEWNGTEADSVTQLWMRDEPPRPLDFCSLTALADVFYPRVWRRRAVMTPVGTVSMTVYFHASADELAATGTDYLLGHARAQSFFNGFFDQSAELWNESGHLLATTHQIVYFKE
ncbi:MAG: thioesterase family protein [Burkholderiaceae bacterium]|nr:thioesterase family protein [Burkholderiaceae bacterium]